MFPFLMVRRWSHGWRCGELFCLSITGNLWVLLPRVRRPWEVVRRGVGDIARWRQATELGISCVAQFGWLPGNMPGSIFKRILASTRNHRPLRIINSTRYYTDRETRRLSGKAGTVAKGRTLNSRFSFLCVFLWQMVLMWKFNSEDWKILG